MDQNRIDIEARIRNAQQLRSEVLGELISFGLGRVKRFLTRFQHLPMQGNSPKAPPAALIALQDRSLTGWHS